MVRDYYMALVFLFGGMITAFAQPQTIPLHGTVIGSDGLRVVDAEITLSFNQSTLAKTRSAIDGSYRFTDIFYGNIHEIDVEVRADYGYSKVKVQNIPIDSIPLDITLKKASGNGVIIYAFKQGSGYIESCRMAYSSYIPWHYYTYHTPWGSYYSKPERPPMMYYPQITQQITVSDANGLPIANARVEVKVPDDEPRWGFTDESGTLTLYMEFERGARFAGISILADGYAPLKRRHQELDVYTENTYQLTKVNF